jgi:hypothetical protein
MPYKDRKDSINLTSSGQRLNLDVLIAPARCFVKCDRSMSVTRYCKSIDGSQHIVCFIEFNMIRTKKRIFLPMIAFWYFLSVSSTKITISNQRKNQNEALMSSSMDIMSSNHHLKGKFGLTATYTEYPESFPDDQPNYNIFGLICVDPDKNIYVADFDTIMGSQYSGIQIYKLSKSHGHVIT